MRYVSFELLVKALQRGLDLDALYEKLEALFYTEPLIIIDANGNVILKPFDAEDIYSFLEKLYENIEKEEVEL
jgi:hypothetical protein